MKNKSIFVAAIPLLLMGVILLLSGTLFGRKEKAPEYVFTYAENQGVDYPTTLGAEYFAELVEEKTDGRIRIIVQYGGAKGAEIEVLEQLRYGGIDLARLSISQMTEYIGELNVLQLPYLYEDSEHMWKVLDGEIGERFLEIVSETDLIGLSWYDAGARSFYTSSKPITCLEDFEGMKIRVQESDMMADMVECLGAEAYKQEYAEVYSVLERGYVQGAENNWPSYESMKHYEVASYFTVDEHTRVPEIQVCSRHTWEKLSEDDREIIAECAKESALYERKLWTEREDLSRKTAIEGGTEVIELTEEEKERFREAVQPVYEKYCSSYMELVEEIIAYGTE